MTPKYYRGSCGTRESTSNTIILFNVIRDCDYAESGDHAWPLSDIRVLQTDQTHIFPNTNISADGIKSLLLSYLVTVLVHNGYVSMPGKGPATN